MAVKILAVGGNVFLAVTASAVAENIITAVNRRISGAAHRGCNVTGVTNRVDP